MAPLLASLGDISARSYGMFGAIPSNTAFEAIQTVTVGAGGSSTITFSSIPSTYSHLQIRGIAKDAGNVNNNTASPNLNINGDSASNYDYHILRGNGSLTDAPASAPDTAISIWGGAIGGGTSGLFGTFVIDILDYANVNKYKTFRTLAGNDSNGVGSSNHIAFSSGLWRSTSGITSLVFTAATAGNFSQYSQFALYGVK